MSSRVAQARAHLRDPLYRTTYSLTLSVVGSGALGTVFWALASRLYDPEIMGVSGAAVAALGFVTGVAGLYLDGGLLRFIPRAGEMTGRLIWGASAISGVTTAVSAGIFLVGLSLWAPDFEFMRHSVLAAVITVVAAVATSLLLVQDAALTGLRRSGWVPIKNLALNALKLPLLALVVVTRYGILLAWVIPTVLAVLPITHLLQRTLVPHHRRLTREGQEEVAVGPVVRYVAGNYVGFLATMAYRNLPPILVLHELGAKQSGFFYPPWVLATTLSLLTVNLSSSLVVEGAFNRGHLAIQTRKAALHAVRLLLPLAILLFLAAPYVLRIFGAAYAANGTTLLRLLAAGLIPSSICILAWGLARVLDRVRTLIVSQCLMAVLMLGLTALLVPHLGIDGVGWAWLISQSVIAAVLLVTELRPALMNGRNADVLATVRGEEG
jgi:O-antigen/teichoic acid export membrane protein